MARELSKQEVADAVKTFAELHPDKTVSTSENGFTIMPGDILVWCADGKLECNEPATKEKLQEIIDDHFLDSIAESPQKPTKAPNSTLPARPHNPPTKQRNGQGGQMVASRTTIRDIQVSDLTMDDITQYLCPKATEQEAFMFLKLCQARGMNPFLKEAYLIKYGEAPATMVVGKEHFTKTAENNPQFDGFEAGIILKDGTRREGTFLDEGDILIGGWAKVYRKDRSKPFLSEVSLKDFIKKSHSGKPTPWDTMPAVMIRKVGLVQALREAFPNDLAGCYDRSEMDQAIEPDYEVKGE